MVGGIESRSFERPGEGEVPHPSQVALDGVAQPPVRAAKRGDAPKVDRLRVLGRGAEGVIGQQADDVAKVLLVDLPDLQLGEQQVCEIHGCRRAAQATT